MSSYNLKSSFSNNNRSMSNIIDIMSKKTSNDMILAKIESNDIILDKIESNILMIENNLKDYVDNGIKIIQEDTKQLTLLKNKLLFIEQLYFKKTYFDNEIHVKINNIEQNMDIFKNILISSNRDIKYIKEHIKIIIANTTIENNTSRWKIWKKIFGKNII